MYNYLAPIFKACFYASLYSRQVKDDPNELSEEDKAEYSENIRKLREDWNNTLNNFAEVGYFGLFPDEFYNKVVNVISKIVNWHLIIETDPSWLDKWNELKEKERKIRIITTELREEIRELLNVSVI